MDSTRTPCECIVSYIYHLLIHNPPQTHRSCHDFSHRSQGLAICIWSVALNVGSDLPLQRTQVTECPDARKPLETTSRSSFFADARLSPSKPSTRSSGFMNSRALSTTCACMIFPIMSRSSPKHCIGGVRVAIYFVVRSVFRSYRYAYHQYLRTVSNFIKEQTYELFDSCTDIV